MAESDVLVVSVVARPGALAPRRRAPFEGGTPAARRSRVEVGGVRRVKWKVRSGRTVIRAGMGVPGVIEAVRALNSCRITMFVLVVCWWECGAMVVG